MLRVSWRPDARLSFQKWLWKTTLKMVSPKQLLCLPSYQSCSYQTDCLREDATTNRKWSLLPQAPEPHSLSCGLHQWNDALCLPYRISKISDWHRDQSEFSCREMNHFQIHPTVEDLFLSLPLPFFYGPKSAQLHLIGQI